MSDDHRLSDDHDHDHLTISKSMEIKILKKSDDRDTCHDDQMTEIYDIYIYLSFDQMII
jgi:hypothetical protein